jgi:hypothetical protein
MDKRGQYFGDDPSVVFPYLAAWNRQLGVTVRHTYVCIYAVNRKDVMAYDGSLHDEYRHPGMPPSHFLPHPGWGIDPRLRELLGFHYAGCMARVTVLRGMPMGACTVRCTRSLSVPSIRSLLVSIDTDTLSRLRLFHR